MIGAEGRMPVRERAHASVTPQEPPYYGSFVAVFFIESYWFCKPILLMAKISVYINQKHWNYSQP
jgi:hypothetical protein